MTDISKMTDQEKSVMLAKAMGWVQQVRHYGDESQVFIGGETVAIVDTDLIPADGLPEYYFMPNLYDPANMVLAWRVLNWARVNDAIFELAIDNHELGDHFFEWASESPADAQRLWLDKILELAIETGIIDKQTIKV